MKSGVEKKKMIQKCIQYVIKENLLLLKDFISIDFNIKKCVY